LRLFDVCPEGEYATLSHRWTQDEITFTDYIGSRKRDTSGYAKIRGLCDTARNRGLKYAWADTCCIDNRSSAELGYVESLSLSCIVLQYGLIHQEVRQSIPCSSSTRRPKSATYFCSMCPVMPSISRAYERRNIVTNITRAVKILRPAPWSTSALPSGLSELGHYRSCLRPLECSFTTPPGSTLGILNKF
jgi:hypothetical protein